MLHEAAKKKKACSQACMHESSQQAVMERQLCGSVIQQEGSIYARVMCIGSRVGSCRRQWPARKPCRVNKQSHATGRSSFSQLGSAQPSVITASRLPFPCCPSAWDEMKQGQRCPLEAQFEVATAALHSQAPRLPRSVGARSQPRVPTPFRP